MAVLVGPTRVADVLPIDVARAVHLLLGCAPGVVGEGMDGARAGALEVLKCPRSCIELTSTRVIQTDTAELHPPRITLASV